MIKIPVFPFKIVLIIANVITVSIPASFLININLLLNLAYFSE